MIFFKRLFSKKEKQKSNMVSSDDVWGELNRRGLQYAINLDWGFYTSNIFEMGQFLYKEKKYKGALELYLEVCYLDLNGPTNSNKEKDEKLLSEYPMWDVKLGFIAPGVIKRVKQSIKYSNITDKEIEEYFFGKANMNFKNLKLPRSSKDVWDKIKKDILG